MFNVMELFSGSKQLVGLDIGSHSLKLAEILETNEGYILNNFVQMPLTKGVIKDGLLIDQEKLTQTIKELFKNTSLKRKGIVTSLSGHSVIVKKVTLPVTDKEELREFLNDEVGKYLPFDNMEEVNFDFQVLGENAFNPNQTDIMIVAAKKEIVYSFTDAIKNAGLSVEIMDVDSFALETMYGENYDFEANDVDVIINIGASITNINVVKNGTATFARDFTLAGNTVTEALQKQLNISFEETEKIKIEGSNELSRSLITYAESICAEIERSIDYFRSISGGENIRKILFAGGGAKIPGLTNNLAQRLNIETEVINPFKNIAFNENIDPTYIGEVGPVAAVVVGLALRRIGDK
jgi:type IV pilus assembly protein PilM